MKIIILTSLLLFVSTTSIAGTITLTVHDYPAGDGPPNLASNGIPLAPGTLFDEADVTLLDGTTEITLATQVLARWHGDNSIRSLLVQFNSTFGGPSKSYSLEVGVARVLSTSIAPVTWDFPKKIIALAPGQLCSSQVVGEQEPLGTTTFTEWETKQIVEYDEIDFSSASLGIARTRTNTTTASTRRINYMPAAVTRRT